jgi:hypothetical protein
MFGGVWKVQCLVVLERFQCLVALERFNTWWPLKGSNGRWCLKGKGKNPFHLFSLSPQQFYLILFFSIDLKVLLYHGTKQLFYAFLSFSLTYKLQPRILMYQIFHTFIVELILIEDFSFSFP